MSWRKSVYGKNEIDTLPDDWEEIRLSILRRDHNRCIVCESTALEERLSIHHIIARCKGGSHDENNLATLCNFCHDSIESKGFNNYEDFSKCVGDMRNDLLFIEPDAEQIAKYDDFHLGVYGGWKNPYTIKIKSEFKRRTVV